MRNGESPFFETPNLSVEGRVGILAARARAERREGENRRGSDRTGLVCDVYVPCVPRSAICVVVRVPVCDV